MRASVHACEFVWHVRLLQRRPYMCLPAGINAYYHEAYIHVISQTHCHTPVISILPQTATPLHTRMYMAITCRKCYKIMAMPFELQHCHCAVTALRCWTILHLAALPLPLRFAATALHCTSSNIALPTPQRCTHLQPAHHSHATACTCAYKYAAQHMHISLHAAHICALTHFPTLNAIVLTDTTKLISYT